MPANTTQHRRTHNILLISRLLSVRENISPFTLLLDSTEQSARPLLQEIIFRANNARTKVIFISFQTVRPPKGVDHILRGAGRNVVDIQQDVQERIRSYGEQSRTVVIIDSLFSLSRQNVKDLPETLSSFMGPKNSVMTVCHTDVPLKPAAADSLSYLPPPLVLVKYLATTILTMRSFQNVLEKKMARDRSQEEPIWGLGEGKEGAIVGLGANTHLKSNGLIIEMEYRRKSGRGVLEWYFMPFDNTQEHGFVEGRLKEKTILLIDHPNYRASEQVKGAPEDVGISHEDNFTNASTFKLDLTEKQRKDREGVVLPYFDAQNVQGDVGEGGRILYEMGVEDDFDEEEDEI